MKTVREVA